MFIILLGILFVFYEKYVIQNMYFECIKYRICGIL